MCRMLVSLCLALVLTSACYAAETNVQLLTSWENPLNADDPLPIGSWGASFVPGQTTGVTDGSYSLAAIKGIGWSQLNMVGGLVAADFADNRYVSFDVTALAADWGSDSGFNMGIHLNSGAGWQQQYDVGIWWWSGNGVDDHETITFDFGAIRNAIVAGGWVQVGFELNSYTNTGLTEAIVYIDNLRLHGTPEPATLALLGMGGLALLRRKK